MCQALMRKEASQREASGSDEKEIASGSSE
jgi:hypothetical protein